MAGDSGLGRRGLAEQGGRRPEAGRLIPRPRLSRGRLWGDAASWARLAEVPGPLARHLACSRGHGVLTGTPQNHPRADFRGVGLGSRSFRLKPNVVLSF